MQKEFIKGIETLNTSVLESMQRLAEINGKAVERATERQFALVADYMNAAVTQMGLFGDVKDVQTVAAVQSKFVSEFGEKLVAHAKQNVEDFESTKGEYTAWLEDGMKQVAENPLAKPIVAAVKKAA